MMARRMVLRKFSRGLLVSWELSAHGRVMFQRSEVLRGRLRENGGETAAAFSSVERQQCHETRQLVTRGRWCLRRVLWRHGRCDRFRIWRSCWRNHFRLTELRLCGDACGDLRDDFA